MDNDTAGVTITETGGSTDVTEAGSTDTYTVVLTSEPTANVMVAVGPDSQVNVSASTLTFTAANWSQAQVVTVTAVDDSVVEGLHQGMIGHNVTSTDGKYDGILTASVTANITDNDTATSPGITVSPTSGLVTTESGGTDDFTVVLDSQPTADVTIGISSSDINEGTVGPPSLTFTSGNWNVPQTVMVTGVDDAVVDGNVAYTVVTAPADSTDTNYGGLNAADVAVTNNDDDPPSEPTTIHVGDLDGASTKLGKGTWSAQVTVLIYDGGENPLVGAVVTGTFTQNGSIAIPASCITLAGGTCVLDSGQLPKKSGNAAFTVDDVSLEGHDYQSSNNHDPDGDSDGTTIALSK